MAHWMFKSEPAVFSYVKLAGEGAKGTDWSGVRNHSAKLNMMAMRLSERLGANSLTRMRTGTQAEQASQ